MNTFPKKVLIANRGEIALRVLRSLQKLGIASVAVYHSCDRHSPLIKSADEAVELSGNSPVEAYMDVQQLIAAARLTGASAIHPGYGFLSENAEFVRQLEAQGIGFIGPSSDVIELMGDKIRSGEFVRGLGFPVLPSVTVSTDADEALATAQSLGLPLVVKAAAGGGGKGMSIVYSLDELADTMNIAASEAGKYFGDKRIYLERYFPSARHIEVQVLGDGERVIHLGERECSVQRRFQKVVEEAPAPGLSSDQRDKILQVATGIAEATGYSSAGTVEFLYTPDDEFFFLEMNTRIQVEHGVTELITGVDLVEQQLRIAGGAPLALSQDQIQFTGHALECRICAEDDEFVPETGSILYLREPDASHLRLDSGLYRGQRITADFDPMLGKLMSLADTRQQAIDRMLEGLPGSRYSGCSK